jgi:hypothetical protein
MIQFFIYPAIPPEDENAANPDSEDAVHASNELNAPLNTEKSTVGKKDDEVDLHDARPSMTIQMPPHHNHDAGTGHIGELVLKSPCSQPNQCWVPKDSKRTAKIQDQESKTIGAG